MIRTLVGVATMLLGAQLAAPAVAATVTDLEEQLVVQARVFAESEYRYVEYVRESDPVTLVAATDNALQVRRTQVYFWPLTNEWLTDRERLDEPVAGRLEVRQDGERVAVLDPTPFVLQQEGDESWLAFGEDAVRARAQFEAGRLAWLEADRAYREGLAEQRQVLSELARIATQNGMTVDPDDIPEPPRAPSPFLLRSTEVTEGFNVKLPAGNYQIQLIDDGGRPLAGSNRALKVIAPGPAEVSYQIVPESQWTQPEASHGDGSVVNAPAGEVIYLIPEIRRPYAASDWTRLLEPQRSVAGVRGVTWVPSRAEELPARLRTSSGLELAREQFQVVQQAGARLGYQIVPANGDRVDLEAFRLSMGGEHVVVAPASSSGPPGERLVQAVSTSNTALVAYSLIAVTPILLAVLWRIKRQRQP